MEEQELRNILCEERETVRREMRIEIAALFTKEKEIMQERMQLYMSVARWSGLAVLAGLTALGVTKADDIKGGLESYFKARLEEEYKLDDPNSKLSNTLNQFMDRALVGSVYIESKAAPKNFIRDKNLNYNRAVEINKLLGVVKNPASDVQVFDQAMSGLSYLADSDDSRSVISRALVQLLKAYKKNSSGWKTTEEQKIDLIMGFPRSELISAAAEGMLINGTSEKTILSALQRFRDEHYQQAGKKVAMIAGSTDNIKMKYESVLTLATIQPTHPSFKKLVLEELLPKSDNEQKLKNIKVAMAIYASMGGGDKADLGKKRIQELALPIMLSAIDTGIKFKYSSYSNDLIITNSVYNTVHVDRSIYGADFIDPLFQSASTVSVARLREVVNSVRPELSEAAAGAYFRVFAKLNETSVIMDESDHSIDLHGIENSEVELLLRTDSRQKAVWRDVAIKLDREYLQLSWVDSSGDVVRKNATLINPAQFRVECMF